MVRPSDNELNRAKYRINKYKLLFQKKPFTHSWVRHAFNSASTTLMGLPWFELPDPALVALAYKYACKYARYVDSDPTRASEKQAKEKVIQVFDDLKNGKYGEVCQFYKNEFSFSDWDNVEKYFTQHPEVKYVGSKQGFMYSYLKTDHGIVRRSEELGSGTFGRTKLSESKSSGGGSKRLSAIKRQTFNPDRKISRAVWIQEQETEANINEDLGIAMSGLVVRDDPSKNSAKTYQAMHYLGDTLADLISRKQIGADEHSLDYAIQLLLKVNHLHTGKASTSNTRYAHRDIKPANTLIDKDGRVHLIDFGLAKSDRLMEQHQTTAGTSRYMPKSFKIPSSNDEVETIREKLKIMPSSRTPNYFFDDKIAALRTLYHPLYPADGILSAYYSQLPSHLQDLLDTHSIEACIKRDKTHTLTFIAAAFIYYKCCPTMCTKAYLSHLMNNPTEQYVLITQYNALRDDAEDLKAKLLDGSIAFQKLLPQLYATPAITDKDFLEQVFDAQKQHIDDSFMLFALTHSGLAPLVEKIVNDEAILTMIFERFGNPKVNVQRDELLKAIVTHGSLSADKKRSLCMRLAKEYNNSHKLIPSSLMKQMLDGSYLREDDSLTLLSYPQNERAYENLIDTVIPDDLSEHQKQENLSKFMNPLMIFPNNVYTCILKKYTLSSQQLVELVPRLRAPSSSFKDVIKQVMKQTTCDASVARCVYEHHQNYFSAYWLLLEHDMAHPEHLGGEAIDALLDKLNDGDEYFFGHGEKVLSILNTTASKNEFTDKDLGALMEKLRNKAIEFVKMKQEKKTGPYAKASRDAFRVYFILKHYLSSPKPSPESIQKALAGIAKYQGELSHHRGMKQVLLDIVNGILFIGGLHRLWTKGEFRLFKAKTATQDLIEKIQTNVNKRSPN